MAKGRFISKEITLDKRVNELSDGFSMVGFTWLITHADREGRTYGDPAVVKSLIFPRRPDVTVEMVEQYIWEWAEMGLINYYEVEGDLYIEFPNFDKHQTGLRKNREAESTIPPNSGVKPAIDGKNRVKLSKVKNKLSEVKVGAKSATPEPVYEDCDPYDGEPIKDKKPSKKSAADPRTKHPAIKAYHTACNFYPPKEIYDLVIQTLGDKPDIVKLVKLRREWVDRGYNKASSKWCTEWYVKGASTNGRKPANEPKGWNAVMSEMQRLEAVDGKPG